MSISQESDAGTQTSNNIFGQPLTIFGMPVDRETIFANHKGQYKSRIEKRQRKLIVKTTRIKFFLFANERIHCLTTGYSPISILEQVLTGLAFLFFKRALLIFTDNRLLHIPTRINRSIAGSVSQILYEDCATIRLKGRQLNVQYKTGYSECFSYIGRKERKKIKSLLSQLPLKPKEAGHLNARTYLCPSCTQNLEQGQVTCQICKLEFKTSLKARLWAALLPGAGYFYTRNPIAGLLFGVIEASAIAFLIYLWSAYTHGEAINFSMLTALTGTLLIEKAITIFHAGLIAVDYIPKSKNFPQQKVGVVK